MTNLIYLAIVVGTIIFIIEIVKKPQEDSSKTKGYQYKKKDFFMSRAEHELYNLLINISGKDYYIFPQVHLSTIVDNKVIGQNWYGAFKHINEKSIDFVLCDKSYISPKLAIELDDSTHNREDRRERDLEVERILKEAGLPLLRIENHGHFNKEIISSKIKTLIISRPSISS